MIGKVKTISETDNFQIKIDELTGAAAASRALIKNSIEDLRKNSAEMTKQKGDIETLIGVLTAKRDSLDIAISQNSAFIEKLVDAVATN